METKPGITTTEFWVTAVSNVAGILTLLSNGIGGNNKYVLGALGVVNGLYAIARGLAKQGVKPTE